MLSKEELDRAFDERFSPDVKEKLNAARVAIAGLGGLGSNIALMLARTGVGHMLLVDYDLVDVTNLNRQVYTIGDINRPKTEALQDKIAEINPYLDIRTMNLRIDENNTVKIFGDYPIVCEAFDNAAAKAMLINSLLTGNRDTVIVSGNGMAGYADANQIMTRKRMKRLYVCGDGETDIEHGIGLMAPRVAICAGHQANKVIQLILGEKNER